MKIWFVKFSFSISFPKFSSLCCDFYHSSIYKSRVLSKSETTDFLNYSCLTDGEDSMGPSSSMGSRTVPRFSSGEMWTTGISSSPFEDSFKKGSEDSDSLG